MTPQKLSSAPIGNLSGHGVSVQTILHGLDSVEEVCAHAVILVDERDAGDAVGGSLTPNGLRLGLNAGNGVEDGDGAVRSTRRQRSTSTVKSTWPGVSMIWNFCFSSWV